MKAIFDEEKELARLLGERSRAAGQVVDCGRGAEFLELNPDLDDEGLGALKRSEAWHHRNQMETLTVTAQELEQSIADKHEASTALCGALLQIAKRGITGSGNSKLVKGPGRDVDGVPLDDLIWAARNQAMHYESPLNAKTQRVFDTLKAKHGARFDTSLRRDLSRAVIDLLDWSNLANYTKDMEAILP